MSCKWEEMVSHFNLNIVEVGILQDWIEGKGKDIHTLSLDELKSLYTQFLDDDPDEEIIDPDGLRQRDYLF